MHAILLDVEYDFDRFSFSVETPPLMLPVVGRTFLDRTMEWLAELEPARVSFVTKRDLGAHPEVEEALRAHRVQLFSEMASALRAGPSRTPLVVLKTNLHPLPNARRALAAHDGAGGVLSHFRGTLKTAPGVYTHGSPVLFFVSSRAAQSLLGRPLDRPMLEIPRILRERGVVSASLEFDRRIVEVNCPFALFDANLGNLAEYRYELYGRGLRPLKPNLWAGEGVDVGDVEFDPRGGLVVVGPRTRFVGRTALRGPAVLGSDVVVGEGSCIHRGLVLDGTRLPPESFIARAVAGTHLHETVSG